MAENNQNSNQNKEPTLSEVLKVRRDKLAALCEAGEDPFVKTKYDVTAYSKDIKENYEQLEGKTVSLGGRIIARRIMGKASFVGLRDGEGDIQLYVSKNDVGDEDYAAFKKWDIGDVIGVSGFVFKTKTGEISVHAQHIELLAKSLLPLPEKFHGYRHPLPSALC